MAWDWYKLADQEVAAVCAALPPDLRDCLAGLSITLEPHPEPDEQSEEGDDENLLGLFVGASFAEAADDLEPLRAVGLDDQQILEAVQVIGMFNMTNRVSTAIGMLANAEYHSQAR